MEPNPIDSKDLVAEYVRSQEGNAYGIVPGLP